MKTGFSKFLTLLILGTVVILTSDSCKKPSAPYCKIIVLIDSTSKPASGATVLLTTYGVSKGKGIIKETLTTDADGETSYTTKLDAVVNLYAYKVTGNAAPKDSLTATGACKLEAGKDNETTLKLRY